MYLRHDPSVRRSLHGRSGPCRSCSIPFSIGRHAIVAQTILSHQTSGWPRRLGSHRLQHFWTGSFRAAGILLLGLHRSLNRSGGDERACASVEGVGVCFANSRNGLAAARSALPFHRKENRSGFARWTAGGGCPYMNLSCGKFVFPRKTFFR